MIKLLLIFVILSFSLLEAQTDISKKIKNTSKELARFDKKNSRLHSKMAKNAKEILKQKKNILKQQRYLQKLLVELSLKEERYKSAKKELKRLEKSKNTLLNHQQKLQEDLVFAIARSISLSMLIDDQKTSNLESLVTEEYIDILNKMSEKQIQELNKQFKQTAQQIENLKKQTEKLQTMIVNIDKKRQTAKALKSKNELALKQLEKNKKYYKKRLRQSINQQKSLQKTLARLNIIQEEHIKKSKKKKRKKTVSKQLPKVKSFGNSYQNIQTKRYRGKKTIAPLDHYTITRKFGPYTDPIYHIKIFNESISLKPKRAGAKVKTVLNGKVILAKKTALLDNVIIVQHANGIHTIYAHLDQIAPTIKKGKKIKKGAVIGRVNDELMFEVTQKNYHINPTQLIR